LGIDDLRKEGMLVATETERSPVNPDSINGSVYQADNITDRYPVRGLDVAESVALLKYHACIMNRVVFDIGVGTGRTTRILAPLANRYTGIDYSLPMVRYVRQHMPEVDVHHADMRHLEFEAQSFDCVFASNNVLDAVMHEDRLHVLGEMHRVLKPGGVFIFSSHNRSSADAIAHTHPVRPHARNPVTFLKLLRHYRQQCNNYRRVQPFHCSNDEYAIMSDEGGHDFALLHYYIDHASQRRQLAACGFTLLDAITRSGESLAPDNPGEHSANLLYVARRD
jgi:SAM-dependent methyltransferase